MLNTVLESTTEIQRVLLVVDRDDTSIDAYIFFPRTSSEHCHGNDSGDSSIRSLFIVRRLQPQLSTRWTIKGHFYGSLGIYRRSKE